MTTASRTEQTEAVERLREWVNEGDTIYCILRHVSRSGMLRVIDLVKVDGDRVYSLGWNAAKAIGWTYDRERDGVKVNGAGMDMGFHLVYTLAQVMYGDGYKLTSRWL